MSSVNSPTDVALDDCGGSPTGPRGFITEAWSEGLVVGAIVILIMMTVANMKRKMWLHRLILIELALALLHGTFVFIPPPAQGWYTSATATLLYISYNLHNVINWMKLKPFLSRWGSTIYVSTIVLVIPYWVAEVYLNFQYNNGQRSTYFRRTRPWEALCRDPWWLFTSVYLVYVIKRGYGFGLTQLIRASARFGILMVSIVLSLAFILADVIDTGTNGGACVGKNPYWKLAFIFKCSADTILLDDFKSVLDRLTARNMRSLGSTALEPSFGDEDLQQITSRPSVHTVSPTSASSRPEPGSQRGRNWSLMQALQTSSQDAKSKPNRTRAGEGSEETGGPPDEGITKSVDEKKETEHVEAPATQMAIEKPPAALGTPVNRQKYSASNKNWFDLYNDDDDMV